MKRRIPILLIAATLASCNKLDLEPAGTITTGQFFQTETDAIAAINGVYQSLTYTAGEQALYGRNLYFLTDMGTDYAAAGASASNFHVQSISKLAIDENNDRVALVWKQLYNGINRANIAIDNIPKVTGDEVLKARLINEAKFVRALLYYNAVRLWGDVPLVLHAPDELDSKTLKVGRTPKEEVYAKIVSDLTDAQALPPAYAAADKGRPTSGSAYALLADVYLTRKDYSSATKTAKYIIDNASTWGYLLVDNFGDLFAKYDKKNGQEHIFSVQFEDGQGGTPGASGQTLSSTSYYGPSGVEPPDVSSSDDVVYNRFSEGDTRKKVSYIKHVVSENGDTVFTFPRALFIKYVPDLNIIYRTHPVNFPVIRYSEVLLIYAEALNEENSTPPAGAYSAINQVRRRAFGKLPYTAPSPDVDLSGLDKDTFRKAVQDERLFEFVQEGKRWFDLVRWGILEEAIRDVTYNGQKIKSSVSKRSYLYPIPQEQRDLNPDGLWQNTGYGE